VHLFAALLFSKLCIDITWLLSQKRKIKDEDEEEEIYIVITFYIFILFNFKIGSYLARQFFFFLIFFLFFSTHSTINLAKINEKILSSVVFFIKKQNKAKQAKPKNQKQHKKKSYKYYKGVNEFMQQRRIQTQSTTGRSCAFGRNHLHHHCSIVFHWGGSREC